MVSFQTAFFLLFCVASPLFSSAQMAVDQAELYGPRMGQGPFCDSECLMNGQWKLRRDWVEGELWTGGYDDSFIWFVDGDFEYWDLRCGQRVNDMILGNMAPSTFVLDRCFPGIIYLMEYVIDYDHDNGIFEELLVIRQAYRPTQEAWDEFVNLVGERISPNFIDQELYTFPWTLFRVIPSMEGSTVTNAYDGEAYFRKRYVANYERNFCTLVGSNLPISVTEYCNFDEDLSSDKEEFVSYLFCEFLFDNVVDRTFFPGCNGNFDSDDSDNCETMVVLDTDDTDLVREDREFSHGFGRLRREAREEVFEKIGKWDENGGNRKEFKEPDSKDIEYDHGEPGKTRPRRGVLNEIMHTVNLGAKVRAIQKESVAKRGFPSEGEWVRPQQGGKKKKTEKEEKGKRGQYDFTVQPIDSDWSEDAEPWFDFYYVPYTSSIIAPYCGYKQD